MSKVVQIRILRDGTVEAVTNGIKGAECTSYISVLEDLLQAETETSNYTNEYYEEQSFHVKQDTVGKMYKQLKLERE